MIQFTVLYKIIDVECVNVCKYFASAAIKPYGGQYLSVTCSYMLSVKPGASESATSFASEYFCFKLKTLVKVATRVGGNTFKGNVSE